VDRSGVFSLPTFIAIGRRSSLNWTVIPISGERSMIHFGMPFSVNWLIGWSGSGMNGCYSITMLY
jgi:hypothetical protein